MREIGEDRLAEIIVSQFVVVSVRALGADVGLAEALVLRTLVVEPFLALSALDVDEVRVHGHLANAVLLPKLRRWHEDFILVHVIGPAEVVVLVSGDQLAVLLLGQHEALAFDGLDVQAEVEIFGGEDLCL